MHAPDSPPRPKPRAGTQIGPTLNIDLPMDFMIGRDLTKTITMSLEIGVPLIKDYPVYDFKAVTRLNVKF